MKNKNFILEEQNFENEQEAYQHINNNNISIISNKYNSIIF